MFRTAGITLMEIIVVIVILGVVLALSLPNFTTPTEQARATNAQNNLLAIYSAEQNYKNNNNSYCTAACSSVTSINTALSLNIQDDGLYSYSCNSITGTTCTATRAAGGLPVIIVTLNQPIQLNSGNPSCTAGNSWCP